jgi:4'-phosphopantetheinyl transferase
VKTIPVIAISFDPADWSDERIREVAASLPEKWTSHVWQYHHLRDRVATLLGRWGLQRLLMENGHFIPATLGIGHKDKPLVSGGPHFNISHSGKWVVVALGGEIPVGIDVERHRKVPEGLLGKYFTPEEQARIGDDPAMFFHYWAAKEAVIKADGRGVEILSKTYEKSTGEFLSDGKTWYVQKLELGEGYACCVATEKVVKFDVQIDIRNGLIDI